MISLTKASDQVKIFSVIATQSEGVAIDEDLTTLQSTPTLAPHLFQNAIHLKLSAFFLYQNHSVLNL